MPNCPSDHPLLPRQGRAWWTLADAASWLGFPSKRALYAWLRRHRIRASLDPRNRRRRVLSALQMALIHVRRRRHKPTAPR